MNRFILIACLFLISLSGFLHAGIDQTSFLQIGEPEKMCQEFITQNFGDTAMLFLKPTGGAFIRINGGPRETYNLCIFCDRGENRLISFHFYDVDGSRTGKKISAYGKQPAFEPWGDTIFWQDTLAPFYFPPPYHGTDSAEYFFMPIDVAVSANGKIFNPDLDYVYVLDQGNHRVAVLRYLVSEDSLTWVKSFGDSILEYPTAIDYLDYGTDNRADDDILVTDGQACMVYRFSASGEYETWYGGPGTGLPNMGYPTGIAVSSEPFAGTFYITDSKNNRVAQYLSYSDAQITYMDRYVFPYDPLPYLAAVDVDEKGYVYVVDMFNEIIYVLTPFLDKKLAEYGGPGGDLHFKVPCDIYIDCQSGNNEMEICELWDLESGIQSFIVKPDYEKRVVRQPNIPARFAAYPTYPNPFNSSATISFDLPAPANVVVDIYNILGQRVARLVDKPYPAGHQQMIWNASSVSSGIYFVKIDAGENRAIKKMLLLK